jgi:hypothetical protein
MSDVADLGGLAHRRVLEGGLPAPGVFRTFGGFGTNVLCALCEERVAADVMEMEVEFAEGSLPPRLTLHVGCYTAWTSVSGSAPRAASVA